MPSTDIDGTPILILSASDIEYLAELMDDASIGLANSFFGRPYEPNDSSTYKKMRKFLDDPVVICWLDDSNEEVTGDLKEEGIDDGKD